MQPNVRRVVFVVAGIILGSAVNMGLVQLGTTLIPPPVGVNVDTPEGLRAAMSVFETKHLITSFMSHALGTFAGAYVASRWSGTSAFWPALIIALLFLIGGISMVAMISPGVMPGVLLSRSELSMRTGWRTLFKLRPPYHSA